MEPLSKVLAADSQERGYRETSLWRREIQGLYFARKQYIPYPLPKFEQMTSQLPSPVFDENPLWVDLYWKTWELAFKNLHAPAPESGFVSQFFDTAFNDNIFLWDSCFMTLFGNLAHPLVPGISMLDNFYVKQHESGEICREIQRESGLDFILWANEADAPLFSRWSWSFPDKVEPTPVVYTDRAVPCPNPRLTLDALNHPVAAWAELESYGVTGDAERLRLVWEPLVRYYRALQKYLRQGNGLYITDWASMDNSPRNPRLDKGGTGVDISAEMVLFARSLSEIAGVIGQPDYADLFRAEADELAERINRLMWDEARKFYFDLTWDGKSANVKTIAGFWPLLAKVASPAQANYLAAELQNPKTFGRVHPVPTCAADEPGYDPAGCYWRGGIWTNTNTMVIRGLENYGHAALARDIALRHLRIVAKVFESTGAVYEMYAPDAETPGMNAIGETSIGDFVGPSGVTPILLLIEYGIGLKPDAPKNQLNWTINSNRRCGCERYRFNGRVVDAIAEPSSNGDTQITIQSDGEFLLSVFRDGRKETFHIVEGKNDCMLHAEGSQP
ncbi:MAG: hypothetical protein K1X65_16095 [Caldilineales bacterium]|nr:hypothetical protein [Caldilineales bacterium]